LKINKKKFQNGIMNPQFEYANIYQSTVPRLGCFKNITENISDEEEDCTEQYDSYFDNI
jgi:hypothetical protein